MFGLNSTDEFLIPEGDSASDESLKVGHLHQIANVFFIEWKSFFDIWMKEMENCLPVQFGKKRLMEIEIIVIAIPAIFLGKSADLGPDRIEVNVGGEKKCIRDIIDNDRTEPALENVPCDFILGLEPVGKARVEIMDARGEISLAHFQVEMVVIGHQAEGIASEAVFD
jgi:hypothetical protein